MYDPDLVRPMREEVTRLGLKELLTPKEVEDTVKQPGTTLVFINSICGCAAGGARPGLTLALQAAAKKPQQVTTVFAGVDKEAVAAARAHFAEYPPSSPSACLLKDGE